MAMSKVYLCQKKKKTEKQIMEYSDLTRQPRTLHPDNLTEQQRYVPYPTITDSGENVAANKSLKSVVGLIWSKYRDKVVKTIWLNNPEKKICEFRHFEITLQCQYKNNTELNQWLNIQLLKYCGITLDMYYLFYFSFTNKIWHKDKEGTRKEHYCWRVN